MRTFLIISFLGILPILSNAQNWSSIDQGIGNIDYNEIEIFSFDNKLFAGGVFTIAGNTPASGIAYWNDRQWLNFNTDSIEYKSFRSFVVYKEELYGFARYTSPSKLAELVKYEKEKDAWSSVPNSEFIVTPSNGTLHDGYISNAIEFQGELYVAGSFDRIGEKNIKSSVAKWDGQTWTPVLDDDEDTFYATTITDMEIFQGALLISGSNFHFNDVASFNGIVRFDGTTWKTLELVSSGPPQAHVIQLEIFKESLYAGGRGSIIPNDNQSYWLVKWNGQEWDGIKGFEQDDYNNLSRITALKTYGNHLVIGGTTNGRTALYSVDSIRYIEQNLNDIISFYEVYNSQLYASGYFRPSYGRGVAKLINLTEIDSLQTNFNLYPNPSDGNFIIEYEIKNKSRAITEIFDSSGKLVSTEIFNDLEGKYVRHINIEDFPSGVYIFKIRTKDFTESKVFIKN